MKISIIGAGNIAKSHVSAFRNAGAEVAAVVTRSEKGAEFAKTHSIPGFYRDVEEMIRESRPDAVAVLTQPDSYREVLAKLKAHNLPVLLEKPLAYTFEEAQALEEVLPEKTMIGLNRRFYSNVTKVKSLIDESKEVYFQMNLPERAKDQIPRDQLTRDHWDMLNDIHGIDLLVFLAGKPEQVLGQDSWGKLDFANRPEYGVTMARTARGHRVVAMNHMDSAGGWRINVFLKQKEIQIFPFEETRIKSLGGLEQVAPDQVDIDEKPGFVRQAQCFMAGITQSILPKEWVSFEEALDSMKAVEMLMPGLK